MTPFYIPSIESVSPGSKLTVEYLDKNVPWVSVTEAREECYMGIVAGMEYTYGTGRGERTYVSVETDLHVAWLRDCINAMLGTKYNVCFLNKYNNDKQQLGWHADDSPGMDLDHPIAVVSFGEPREIWWRENGYKGVIPLEQRKLLENGSCFIMPAGMQRTHQHRIPKGDRPMGMRVSLTFRRYVYWED